MITFTETDTSCVRIDGLSSFHIDQIFDCGQCFRFEPAEDGGWEGVAMGRYVRFHQPVPGTLEIHNATFDDYERVWKHYLALDTDYAAIRADIAAHFPGDAVMADAMRMGEGIRILRQDPWETLISFIISQNNNIPRIKKIIRTLCDACGEPITCGGRVYRAFPTAEALAELGVERLYELRTGFRAKYIYDAAVKVRDELLDFDEINAADYDRAAELLSGIKGVGPKVAACVLLFGFGKTEAFPVDVWIKRVLAKYYPDGLDVTALGRWAGLAQQYLFYYERYQ